jgi:hypothetical protein
MFVTLCSCGWSVNPNTCECDRGRTRTNIADGNGFCSLRASTRVRLLSAEAGRRPEEGSGQMQMTTLDNVLWATIIIEDVILCFVLVARRRVRSFPVFTALIALDVARAVALVAIERAGTAAVYFYTYWSLAVADIALQFGVLYGVASKVFRPAGRWANDTTGALICLIVGSIATAVLLTWMPKPVVVLPLQQVILKGNFFSAVLMSELSVGILAISAWAGLSGTPHAAKIIQGFVAYSLCTLALETARTYCGVTKSSRVYDDLSHLRVIAYALCMAHWIISLWADAPPPRELPSLMREQVSAIGHVVAGRVEARRAGAKP